MSLWDKCQAQVDKVIAEASKLFSRSRSLGKCGGFVKVYVMVPDSQWNNEIDVMLILDTQLCNEKDLNS